MKFAIIFSLAVSAGTVFGQGAGILNYFSPRGGNSDGTALVSSASQSPAQDVAAARAELDQRKLSADALKLKGRLESLLDARIGENDWVKTFDSGEIRALATLTNNIYNNFEHESQDLKRLVERRLQPNVNAHETLLSLFERSATKFTDCGLSASCMATFKEEMNMLMTDEKIASLKTVTDVLLWISQVRSTILTRIDELKASMTHVGNQHALMLAEYPIFKTGYFEDYTVFRALYRNGGQFSGAVIASPDSSTIIVAYAGTKSCMDWVKDFYISKGGGNSYFGVFDGIQVSKGTLDVYLESAAAMIEAINAIVATHAKDIEKLKKLRFITVGHSLGGAMSILALYHIKMHMKDKVDEDTLNQMLFHNISFGAPRILSTESAAQFDEFLRMGNMIRIWNERDLVPAAVPEFIDRKHVGVDFVLNDSIWHDWYMPIIAHHSAHRYFQLAVQGIKKVQSSVDAYNAELEKIDAASKKLTDLQKNTLNTLKQSAKKIQDTVSRIIRLDIDLDTTGLTPDEIAKQEEMLEDWVLVEDGVAEVQNQLTQDDAKLIFQKLLNGEDVDMSQVSDKMLEQLINVFRTVIESEAEIVEVSKTAEKVLGG